MENSTPNNNSNSSENPQSIESMDSWKRAEEATRAKMGILMLGELMFQQALKAYQKKQQQKP